ncbi:lipase member H-B [Anabrus simplex]|uniref:lipase member H-B n=1 Tax=Anabrus simplex TaxID=316456 RepID=UPI0034DCF56C
MVPSSSKVIARALDNMIDAGAGLCHMSGFSLGGHAVGHVARNMRNRVRHLVALDPAGPLFYKPVKCVSPISDNDADCVEVLHTDRGKFGAPVKTGTVDYWMNGGIRLQPGCFSITCSHTRALFYWIESLQNPSSFVSRQCSSWLSFLLNFCSGNNVAIIGQCNKNTIPGNYFLRTKRRRPFGIGPSGSSPAFIIPRV